MGFSDDVIFRRSTKQDSEAVFEITSASVNCLSPYPYPKEVVDTWMTGRTGADYLEDCSNHEIWIAEHDEIPIEFAHAVPGELKRLFVYVRYAGKGVGAALMERALLDAQQNESGAIKIDATLNAVPFYEKWGFKQIGKSFFPGRDESLPQIDVIVLELKI